MAGKMFDVGLRLVARRAYKYAVRYQTQLNAHLTAPQVAALASFISCVLALLVALGDETVGD